MTDWGAVLHRLELEVTQAEQILMGFEVEGRPEWIAPEDAGPIPSHHRAAALALLGRYREVEMALAQCREDLLHELAANRRPDPRRAAVPPISVDVHA